MSIRKLCKCTQAETFPKRRYGKQRELPRHLRRAAAKMSKTLNTALLDLIHFCKSEKIDLTLISRDVLEQAAQRLMATGLKSARSRILAWRRALDALRDDVKRVG